MISLLETSSGQQCLSKTEWPYNDIGLFLQHSGVTPIKSYELVSLHLVWMFSWLDSPPSRVSLPYSGLPSLSQRPVITECHSHQYRQKWGRSRAVSSLCPLSLCHLFHSAADLHFPHSSICCFLYQTRAFLDLGSICIFLGHLPLLPILYTSLLCLALVRSSFLIFAYLLLPFACIPVCWGG